MSEENLNPVEQTKLESHYLQGTIPAELKDENPFFSKESTHLLKHHGTYQQDHRDLRKEARAMGRDKYYSFMVRTRIPGGKLTSRQLLAELDLCDELGDTTLRVTSRQGLQLHGILKDRLQPVIERINSVQLTTLGACGDLQRNVMCCPAPHRNDPVHQEMQNLTDALTEHLAPRTKSYHQIWLTHPENGEKELVGGGPDEVIEPIYGKTYLPRKFKTAVGLPDDNCVDMYTNDLAFMAICVGGRVEGYNVLVGGGMGVTPTAVKTFPALAKKLAFVTPDQAVAVAEAVVCVQRDFGNREDRKVARLKYLIHNWGLDAFRAKVEEYYGRALTPPTAADVTGFDDHIGWREQGDGLLYYGLNIENGRIVDNEKMKLKSALRRICREFPSEIRLTSHQSILFTDIVPDRRLELETILRDAGVPLSEDISTVRRWSMACVAWPTCGLAITESERALPGIIDQLEVELAKLALDRDEFTVRMTGCPNACARPYNSDIGLVGKTLGKYTVYLGGRRLGDRLNFVYKDLVAADDIVPTLRPVLAFFKSQREPNETLGDFCFRQGQEKLAEFSEKFR
ncbi:MAG: NADPH-dependent assimilatory sulfite reductase hemoprotein subunit [Planctomycetota bacterium]|nr:NADPH-dependent assimilatory sulfite reductase hemoprotein subunit [Planctomycetota bacterium]MDA1177971.1 NADPH-dependent assimilatory sulfite reductase hemoprotein subunit [Planctomycetota bacterium]